MSHPVRVFSFSSLIRLSNLLQFDPVLLTVYFCDALIISISESSDSSLALLSQIDQLLRNLKSTQLPSYRQLYRDITPTTTTTATIEEMLRLLLNDILFVMLRSILFYLFLIYRTTRAPICE